MRPSLFCKPALRRLRYLLYVGRLNPPPPKEGSYQFIFPGRLAAWLAGGRMPRESNPGCQIASPASRPLHCTASAYVYDVSFDYILCLWMVLTQRHLRSESYDRRFWIRCTAADRRRFRVSMERCKSDTRCQQRQSLLSSQGNATSQHHVQEQLYYHQPVGPLSIGLFIMRPTIVDHLLLFYHSEKYYTALQNFVMRGRGTRSESDMSKGSRCVRIQYQSLFS